MRGGPGGPSGRSSADPAAAVARMFKLDANKDGIFTREELTALFTKEAAEANAARSERGPGGTPSPR